MLLWPRKRTSAAGTEAPAVHNVSGVTDLHCHILPGIDDGSPDLATSLEMARIAVAEGITTIVATPHTRDGVYDVAEAAAREAQRALTAALAAAGIALEVRVGGEVHLHEGIPALLRERPGVTLDGNGRYLLLELPHQGVPPGLSRFLFELRAAGVTPVIAHPERNLGVRDDPEVTEEWVRMGSLLQVTAGSVSGAFGPVILACAQRLLRAGRVHVLATDAHSLHKRPPRVQDAFLAAARIVGEAGARALLEENPRRIAAGEPPASVAAPGPLRRRAGARR